MKEKSVANQLTEKIVELNTLKLLESVKYQKDMEKEEKINFASNLIKCREILNLSRMRISVNVTTDSVFNRPPFQALLSSP